MYGKIVRHGHGWSIGWITLGSTMILTVTVFLTPSAAPEMLSPAEFRAPWTLPPKFCAWPAECLDSQILCLGDLPYTNVAS